MPMKIDAAECTVCGSCEFECPNHAVKMKGETYVIDPDKCTDCVGIYDKPNCAANCPADCISPL